MIPCKRNKCLLYPACRYKSIIYCEILFSYVQSLYKGRIDKVSHSNMWLDINKNLINLNRVFPEPEIYVRLDTLSLQSRFPAHYLAGMNKKGQRFTKNDPMHKK